MNITLSRITGETVAVIPITTDEHGYLYAEHPTLQFEVDCALYGFQEGRVSSGTIDDQFPEGAPVMTWTVA